MHERASLTQDNMRAVTHIVYSHYLGQGQWTGAALVEPPWGGVHSGSPGVRAGLRGVRPPVPLAFC